MWYLQRCRYHIFCIYLLENEFDFRAAFFRFLENLRRGYFCPQQGRVPTRNQKKIFAKIGDYREELESLLTLKFRLVNSQTISF